MKEAKNLKKRLLNDTYWGFISITANRIGSLVLTILIARFLLPENYGSYSLVLSTALIFYMFADLGVNRAFIRYVSHSLAHDRKKTGLYYVYFRNLKLLMSLGASIALVVFAWPIVVYVFRDPALLYPLLVSAMYILLLNISEFYSHIFYIAEKISYAAIKELINFSLRILFALWVFSAIAAESQITSLFVAFSIVVTVTLVFNILISKKLIPRSKGSSRERIDTSRIKSFVFFASIASLSAATFSHIDAIMLGYFLSPEFVGYYRAAFSLIFGVLGFIAFPNLFLLPVFSKLAKSQTQQVFAHAFRYMAMLTVPITVGMWLVGKYFIGVLYGNSYLPGTQALYVLSLTLLPAMGVGLFISLLSSKEQPKIFAKLVIVTGVLNILLNIVLIRYGAAHSPLAGVLGASIATTISWYFYFVLSVYTIRKKLGYNLNLSCLIKPVFASFVMGITLFFLFKNVVDMNLFLGILQICLGVVVYVLAMFLLKGFTKQDLTILKMATKRK